ncbi:hypothetical protein NKG94_50135 [Micromonospora sp. M12]
MTDVVAGLVPTDPLRRKLIAIRLAESIGKGVFLSGSVVYFTLRVGLDARQVGLGLSAAGLSAFLSSVLFGVIADRVGARRLLVILFAALAVGFGSTALSTARPPSSRWWSPSASSSTAPARPTGPSSATSCPPRSG